MLSAPYDYKIELIKAIYLERRPIFHVNLYPGFSKHLPKGIVVIGAETNQAFYPGIYQHLGAKVARRMRAVDGTTLQADAVQGGLYDNVLLGVNTTADFMPRPRRYPQFITQTTAFQTVSETRRSAIITRGQYVFILYRHGADVVPPAG